MPTASYYREQARLLMRWGQLARDPAVAEQLTNRAQQMLEMAEQRDEQRADQKVGDSWIEVAVSRS